VGLTAGQNAMRRWCPYFVVLVNSTPIQGKSNIYSRKRTMYLFVTLANACLPRALHAFLFSDGPSRSQG
jgi:hypothetical protein